MGDGDVGDGDDDDVDGDGRLDGDVRPDLSTSTSTASHLEAFELPSKLNLDILLKIKDLSSKVFLTIMCS